MTREEIIHYLFNLMDETEIGFHKVEISDIQNRKDLQNEIFRNTVLNKLSYETETDFIDNMGKYKGGKVVVEATDLSYNKKGNLILSYEIRKKE